MMKPGRILILFLFLVIVVACSNGKTNLEQIKVNIVADGKILTLDVESGLSVAQILSQNEIILNTLDKVEPPSYTLLINDSDIRIIRVVEEFLAEEQSIPFEHQTVQNESLTEGQTLLIQPGYNGSQQVTYRRILEDGMETSKTIFQITTISDPIPEIVMVGVHAPFTALPIAGELAYLIAGNAWIMEETTGNRRPVVTTGDLDGFVFSISPDEEWLLYTRKLANDEDSINNLWVIDIKHEGAKAIDLGIKNIYHFADWVANQDNTITYSTVEPRSSPPGWQANNDLHILTFTSNGTVMRNEQIIDSNSGGAYGWWGTDFAWSPNSKTLVFARPDGIGAVDLENADFIPFLEILPYDSQSDWAWIPPINWSPDNRLLFTLVHGVATGTTIKETSTRFDLCALDPINGSSITIVQEVGMFATPVPSPFLNDDHFYVTWLQAVFPNQSDTSRYKLMIMDRDGSNKRTLFPREGLIGMEPQTIEWAPNVNSDQVLHLGLVYQGNIWMINSANGETFQITGDGLITAIDWK